MERSLKSSSGALPGVRLRRLDAGLDEVDTRLLDIGG